MVELRFYIAKKGNLYDKLIWLATGCKYSHVELWINGTSFSSSSRDGGVRAKKIDYKPGKWQIVDLKNSVNLQRFYNFFDATNECGYDYLSVAFKTMGNKVDLDKTRWYCSEWVAAALNILYGTNIDTRIFPDELLLQVERWNLTAR